MKPDRDSFRTLPRQAVTVVLDRVTRNYNIDAMFRLCDAFLIGRLVICGKNLDLKKRKLTQAARGTERWVPWEQAESALPVIQETQASGARRLRSNFSGIREIKPLWKSRRANRMGRPPGKTILEVLHNEPSWFSDRKIKIVAYDERPSKQAQDKFESISPSHYHRGTLAKYKSLDTFPFYEDPAGGRMKMEPGGYVLDYFIDRKKGIAEYCGMWQVRNNDAFHSVPNNSTIILSDEVSRFGELSHSLRDARKLGTLVFEYVKARAFKQDNSGNMLNISLEDAASAFRIRRGLQP